MEKLYRKFGCSTFYLGEKFNSERGIRLSLELDPTTHRPCILNVYSDVSDNYLRIFCLVPDNRRIIIDFNKSFTEVERINSILHKYIPIDLNRSISVPRPSRTVVTLMRRNPKNHNTWLLDEVLKTDTRDCILQTYSDLIKEHKGSKYALKKVINNFYNDEESRRASELERRGSNVRHIKSARS